MRTRQEKLVRAGDGTALYARQTQGPQATATPIICANGIGVSTFFWRYLEDHFSPTRPVIVWDYRGHGESERPRDMDGLTIEANADDLRRVLDAFGHERAILCGHSMGCQVIYTFGHRWPERAATLVPMLGTYGRPVHTFMDREASSVAAFLIGHWCGTRATRILSRSQRRLLTHPLGRRVASRLARLSGLVHATDMPQQDLENYLDHFAAFCPSVFFRMAEKMATHTAGPYLERIVAPTLVVAGERDLFTPLWLSEEAADRLPRARLLVLREGSHAALVEQPAVLHRAIEEFLVEHGVDAGPAPAARASRVARGQLDLVQGCPASG